MRIAAVVAVSVFAVGLLSGPATASADGPTCSNNGVNVGCVGQVNGGLVNVTVGDVGSGNDLSGFASDLSDAFLAVANISDINILAAELNSTVQLIVNQTFNTTTILTTCSVIVTPSVPPTGSGAIAITCG